MLLRYPTTSRTLAARRLPNWVAATRSATRKGPYSLDPPLGLIVPDTGGASTPSCGAGRATPGLGLSVVVSLYCLVTTTTLVGIPSPGVGLPTSGPPCAIPGLSEPISGST